jgi:CubicO group peptidase (beta-lactamase class C family)
MDQGDAGRWGIHGSIQRGAAATGLLCDIVWQRKEFLMPALFRFVLLSLLTLIPAWAHAADPTTDRIDKVFAAWDKPDSPGASVAVVRDGRVIYSRGYGQAQLEYAVPNTPATTFHAASVSKQFTAFAIQLLVQEGKLSLDDEVRKHVPELQLQGPPVTIRQLVHHTSGCATSGRWCCWPACAWTT